MLHEVVIQLLDDVAGEMKEQRVESDANKELLKVANELNVEMIPHSQGTGDNQSASSFSIMTSDAKAAEQIRDRCAKCKGVSAAYIKPQGAPP